MSASRCRSHYGDSNIQWAEFIMGAFIVLPSTGSLSGFSDPSRGEPGTRGVGVHFTPDSFGFLTASDVSSPRRVVSSAAVASLPSVFRPEG